MQEISIYAMAHVPPFPRKSTSNQIRSPLLPNLVESIGLNSKIIPHGIVNTRSERSHSRPSFSSYSSPVPVSVSASTSSNLSLDFQRIRRRKKKLKRVKSWSRDRFESLEDVQDGDADVEKDEEEDESKIVSKIKSRRLKKINSSHSIHPSHSQFQLQLHSFWILICLIFSMMFFKFQSS
ncbi:hypothetical protein DFH28DRAFT_540452 [Melampsora americana]|nr:hypothetical protein DFH28DRAFT_540452 [Melampsora americana]